MVLDSSEEYYRIFQPLKINLYYGLMTKKYLLLNRLLISFHNFLKSYSFWYCNAQKLIQSTEKEKKTFGYLQKYIYIQIQAYIDLHVDYT